MGPTVEIDFNHHFRLDPDGFAPAFFRGTVPKGVLSVDRNQLR